MSPGDRFPGLSLAQRPDLFDAIRAHGTASAGPVSPCAFGGETGWLVSDLPTARALLTSSAGQKSRPAHSQRLLGGVGVLQADQVRSVKRRLVTAMGREARRQHLLAVHLDAALRGRESPPGPGTLTEALSASLLAQLTGQEPGSVDGGRLRELVRTSWARLERPAGPAGHGPGGTEDDLASFVHALVEASHSGFTRHLRDEGWTTPRIAEELRAMILAGWGSTTAAVLSAVSLGAASQCTRPALDEVLRMYPPSFMIARRIMEPRRAFPFAAGDLVLVSPWLIHRDGRAWARPDDYTPSRWQTTPAPHWFLPFGLGPRRCPAATFARTQIAAAAELFADRFPPPVSGRLTLVESRSPALVPCWDDVPPSRETRPAMGGGHFRRLSCG
ncbi:cytochrome P450 [Streptomyces sp. G-G2]|uniref:cytochrome P450 n=1 Tax=Streptomyces sp. G-G2 TaxID=3046201 RepID=UPI0024B8FC21|nr:cytochrome P450 [Streptomyces sp. G-G2]MDJ0382360.1 cytochrome P450 [Streptomyces sp. G-G2]